MAISPKTRSALNDAEKKWYERATSEEANKMYVSMLKKLGPSSYASKLAEKFGVSEDTVRSAPAYKRFTEFASNAENYADKRIAGINAAYKNHKWAIKWSQMTLGVEVSPEELA